MPYTTEWYIENRVFLITFSGDVTLDEIFACDAESAASISAVGKAPVHVLIDDSAVASMPTDLLSMRQAIRHVYRHPNLGWLCNVGDGPNAVVPMMMASLAQMFHVQNQRVRSLDEALSRLLAEDDSLSDFIQQV